MIDKSKIEYVIGIDLGHGETSAAMCPTQWDTQMDQLEAAKDIEMGGNKKVMPSAITILSNGNAYIGDSAFNPDVLKQSKVRVCFKQAPKDINGEAEQLMIRFMSEVYKLIRENNSGLLHDGNHLVYIATPSGWDKETQDLYGNMAKEAGIPLGGVTKESRAAFVRAQQDVTSGLGRNIERGAIVFDMGSSTLDFTYMNKNLPNMIDHGYDCGASFIEKSIFADKESEDKSIKLFEKKFPDLVDYLLFEARKVKEQVYFNTELKVKKTINFDDIIEDEELEDERFKLMYMPGELNEMLKEKGYMKQISDAMLDYAENHIKGQSIYGVFMTGGASRMDFLKPIIEKCWGVPEEKIYRDQDPSLTISQGVAEVARMDLRTEGMDKGLGQAIDNVSNGTIVFEDFVNNFGHDLWDKVTDDMAATITDWRDNKENANVCDLQKAIEDTVSDSVSDFSSNATNYVHAAIQNNTEDIRNKVDAIVKHYAAEGIHIDVNTDICVDSLELDSLNLVVCKV